MPAGTYSLIRLKDDVIEEEIINSSGNVTVLETTDGSYRINRKYRNSLLLELIMGVNDENFSLVYRNQQIKVYIINS
jgi:dolichyl-diphosphooligosaccharide--protein glycosyltransferase